MSIISAVRPVGPGSEAVGSEALGSEALGSHDRGVCDITQLRGTPVIIGVSEPL